jgi:uncharacterized iron-regulated membrane protein
MSRIIALIAIVAIILIAVWIWAGREPGRSNGQQPAPHAIDQSG